MHINAQIKICGIKSIDDIDIINNFDIDYIGFVFAKSKRKVLPKDAFNMKKHLKKGVKTVGVFADMDISEINEIAEFVKLDIVQLHSDETDEMCKEINFPVWKSISVKSHEELIKADKFKNAEGILLDTYNKKLRGGTGESFNWKVAENFSQNYFTILAGGINADNIIEAYKTVKPHIIDISSSCETDGHKDYKKIEQLIRRIN